MPENVFNNLKTYDDFRRADEEFQMKKQEAASKAEAAKNGQNLPASIQVDNEIARRLKSGDIQGANRLFMVHRSGAYGTNTFGDQLPQQTNVMPASGAETQPAGNGQQGLMGFLGNLINNSATSNAAQNAPAATASPNTSYVATPMAGIGESIAHNAGLKKTAETQGQKDVELNMDPAIAGGVADAKNNSELNYAAPITAAKKTADINATQVGDLQKKADSANNMGMLTARARSLLNSGNASGSLGGAILSAAKGKVGISDATTQTNSALTNIGADLTSSVPRMEGPQSDADRIFYAQQAGNVANPQVPAADKLAALDEIDKLNEKYKGINTPQKSALSESISTMPASEVPADIQANMGNVRVTPQTDYQQKEAAFNAKKAANYKSKYGLE